MIGIRDVYNRNTTDKEGVWVYLVILPKSVLSSFKNLQLKLSTVVTKSFRIFNSNLHEQKEPVNNMEIKSFNRLEITLSSHRCKKLQKNKY